MTISDTMWKAISILGQKQRQGSRNPEDDFLLMGKGSGKRVGAGKEMRGLLEETPPGGISKSGKDLVGQG